MDTPTPLTQTGRPKPWVLTHWFHVYGLGLMWEAYSGVSWHDEVHYSPWAPLKNDVVTVETRRMHLNVKITLLVVIINLDIPLWVEET